MSGEPEGGAPSPPTDLGAFVAAEREERRWSIRTCIAAAAELGQKFSNTQWSTFEQGRTPLTPTIRAVVAAAFRWSMDWPERRPSSRDAAAQARALAQLEGQVALLAEQYERRDALVERLGAEIDLRNAQLEAVERRLDRLEQRRAR